MLGLIIIYLRRHIPESPRWLMTHGHDDEAERTVDEIEAESAPTATSSTEVDETKALEVVRRRSMVRSARWRTSSSESTRSAPFLGPDA